MRQTRILSTALAKQKIDLARFRQALRACGTNSCLLLLAALTRAHETERIRKRLASWLPSRFGSLLAGGADIDAAKCAALVGLRELSFNPNSDVSPAIPYSIKLLHSTG